MLRGEEWRIVADFLHRNDLLKLLLVNKSLYLLLSHDDSLWDFLKLHPQLDRVKYHLRYEFLKYCERKMEEFRCNRRKRNQFIQDILDKMKNRAAGKFVDVNELPSVEEDIFFVPRRKILKVAFLGGGSTTAINECILCLSKKPFIFTFEELNVDIEINPDLTINFQRPSHKKGDENFLETTVQQADLLIYCLNLHRVDARVIQMYSKFSTLNKPSILIGYTHPKIQSFQHTILGGGFYWMTEECIALAKEMSVLTYFEVERFDRDGAEGFKRNLLKILQYYYHFSLYGGGERRNRRQTCTLC